MGATGVVGVRFDHLIGESLTSVEETLRAAGVTFAVAEGGDSLVSYRQIEFEDDGFAYRVELDPYADHVRRIHAMRTLADLDDGLHLVRQHASRAGRPAELRLLATASTRSESFGWVWHDGARLDIDVGRSKDEPWRARIHVQWLPAPQRPQLDLDAARGLVSQVRSRLAGTRSANGGRGAAVASWVDLLGWRLASLERFLDAVATTTPEATISRAGLDELVEHATWLAQHHELFDQPDDWRDVLVVTEALDGLDRQQLGWRSNEVREGDRRVRHVVGPFATGVHRVLCTVDELYSLRDDLPIHEVTIDRMPIEPSYKLRPQTIVASLGDVSARFEVFFSDDELVARLLVAARARRA